MATGRRRERLTAVMLGRRIRLARRCAEARVDVARRRRIAVLERYVIRDDREGYDRLRALARAHGPNTSELLARVAILPGMRCLDLGCGGGEVTFELAQLVGPEGSVVGIDMDEAVLALARKAAANRGRTNVEFRVANVNDWDAAAAYDLVYSRLLLQHLSRPVELLQRMWAAVRPGGAIIVEDADFDGLFCHPPNAGFDFYARLYRRVLEHRGGDAASGRKLYGYFLEAAIPDPDLRLVQRADAVGEAKALALSTLAATAAAIVEEQLASAHEVNAALADLNAFTADAKTVIGGPRIFQLWSRRPQPDQP